MHVQFYLIMSTITIIIIAYVFSRWLKYHDD